MLDSATAVLSSRVLLSSWTKHLYDLQIFISELGGFLCIIFKFQVIPMVTLCVCYSEWYRRAFHVSAASPPLFQPDQAGPLRATHRHFQEKQQM